MEPEYDEIIEWVRRGETARARDALQELRKRAGPADEARPFDADRLSRRMEMLEQQIAHLWDGITHLADSRHLLEQRVAALEDVVRREGTDVTVCAPYRLRLKAEHIEITAQSSVSVASAVTEVSAGMFKANAGFSQFGGTITADTLITNSVVSAVYSPGAGNIW